MTVADLATDATEAGPVAPPLPFAPLAEKAGAPSMLVLAEAAGVAPATLYRWRRSGVPVLRADELAVALGFHPVEVWPEWLTPADVEDVRWSR